MLPSPRRRVLCAHSRDRQRASEPQCQGQVVLQLKSAYRDGTTHIVMLAQEFMQRLAALVPRPTLLGE